MGTRINDERFINDIITDVFILYRSNNVPTTQFFYKLTYFVSKFPK